MVIYNIVKMEASGSTVINTAIGYLDELDDKNTFETYHGTPFPDWAVDNPGVDLVDYFDTHDPCYLIDTVGFILDGLTLITDLENPEG